MARECNRGDQPALAGAICWALPFDPLRIRILDPRLAFGFWRQQLCRLMICPREILNPDRRSLRVKLKADTIPLKETVYPIAVVTTIGTHRGTKRSVYQTETLGRRVEDEIVWP